jgi:hypothetical protein
MIDQYFKFLFVHYFIPFNNLFCQCICLQFDAAFNLLLGREGGSGDAAVREGGQW